MVEAKVEVNGAADTDAETREILTTVAAVLRVVTPGAAAAVVPTAGVLAVAVVPIGVTIRKTSFFLCCWANRGSSVA